MLRRFSWNLLWTLVLGLFLPAVAGAKIYYVNQGVKYHIGDQRYTRSEDAVFLDAYPVVGQEWIQAFTVSEEDVVKVHIDHIWGVDDCPYCKIIVSIDNHDMGRLTHENNHEPFNTLSPLAMPVRPGHVYQIKVASYGRQQVDDMVFEGLRVETEAAEVKFLTGPIIKQPDQPMPTAVPTPTPLPGCGGGRALTVWLPMDAVSKDELVITSVAQFNERELAQPIEPGQYLETHVKVGKVEEGTLVGQAVEILLGTEAPSGWVFNFNPGSDSILHANMKAGGVYRAALLDASSYRPGAWNTFRLARCLDGSAKLFVNGVEMASSLGGLRPSETVLLRVRGMSVEFARKAY